MWDVFADIVKKWKDTEEQMRLTMHRRAFGLHAPLRLQMEKALVNQVRRIPVLPTSNLGLEILEGRDQTIDYEDFLGGVLRVLKPVWANITLIIIFCRPQHVHGIDGPPLSYGACFGSRPSVALVCVGSDIVCPMHFEIVHNHIEASVEFTLIVQKISRANPRTDPKTVATVTFMMV